MTRLLIRNGFLQALPSFEPANQNHKRESQSENLKSLFSCRGLFGSSAPALGGVAVPLKGCFSGFGVLVLPGSPLGTGVWSR